MDITPAQIELLYATIGQLSGRICTKFEDVAGCLDYAREQREKAAAALLPPIGGVITAPTISAPHCTYIILGSEGEWIPEKSSGHDGFSCVRCGTWIYKTAKQARCDCDRKAQTAHGYARVPGKGF